jgi:hypothetical protein
LELVSGPAVEQGDKGIRRPFGLQWKRCRSKVAARRRAAGAMLQDDSGKGTQRFIGFS